MVLPRSVSGIFSATVLGATIDGPSPGGHDGFERRRIEVVEVDVGHQHEIGLGQVGERLDAADRIDVDRLAVPLHEEGRVVYRMDHQDAVVGGDLVAGKLLFLGSASGGHCRAAQQDDSRNDGKTAHETPPYGRRD